MQTVEEERKRAHDSSDSHEPKRMRADEIIGPHDDNKVTTRILMSRHQFSKIIGKGGATILHIRSSCGAIVKGSDVDAENRLIVLTGTPRQVLEAFEVVSELLFQAHAQTSPNEHFSMQLLLEHNKAGRVVGQKGATMQSLKLKSGTSQIRMQKDPQEYSGVQLRTLTIEGLLPAIRRAHYFLLELFFDPFIMSSAIHAPVTGGYGAPGGMTPVVSESVLAGMGGGGGGSSYSVGGQAGVHYPGPPLEISSLVSYGLQAETVRQLSDMKTYLSRQFGLELSISKEMTAPSAPPQNLVVPTSNYSNVRQYSEEDLVFAIPRSIVGGIIGKGGQQLKDLQSEFGVRVYVEKDTSGGNTRTVVIKPPQSSERDHHREVTADEKAAMACCQQKILTMCEELTFLASQSSSNTSNVPNSSACGDTSQGK